MEYSSIGFEVLVTRHDSLKLQNVRVFGTFGVERNRKRVLFMNKDSDSLQVISNDGDKALEKEVYKLFRKPFVGSSQGNNAPLTTCSLFSDRNKSSLLPPKYAFIGGNLLSLKDANVDDDTYDAKIRSVDQYIESVKVPFVGKRWKRMDYSSDRPGVACALVNSCLGDPPLTFTIVSEDLTELGCCGNVVRMFDSALLAIGGSWDGASKRFKIGDDDPYTLLYFNSEKIDKKLHNFLLKAQFSPIVLFDGNNFFSRILPELKEQRQKEFVSAKGYYVPANTIEMVNLGEVYEWYVVETKLLDTFTHFKSNKW